MIPQYDLIKILSDGQFHSGEKIANSFCVSRAAICKAIHVLEKDLGLQVHSVRGRGYRLPKPVELLDEKFIRNHLKKDISQWVKQLDIQFTTESTNQYLMQKLVQGTASGYVCLAEQQTAGRGRRGRAWVSPFGGNIYLSLSWRFESGIAELTGLSITIAVAVIRTLHKYGVVDAQLKWPNDILWQQRKLCGILLEMRGEATGPCMVVIGVGLNVSSLGEHVRDVEQPWVDLYSILNKAIPRNILVADLISELISAIITFSHSGLAVFLPEWHEKDLFYKKPVQLILANETVLGIATGVDESGAIVLEKNGQKKRYLSGDVSLRQAKG